MPQLEPAVWALIGGGVVIVIILVGLLAARRGRRDEQREQKVRRSQTVRVVLVVLLLTLIVGFAVANRQAVTFDWLVTSTTAPLFVVVGLSGLSGFLVGVLVAYRRKSE